MQQLQNQPEIQKKFEPEEEDEDEYDGHHQHQGGDDEMDEDDLKMYEQFLAANGKQQEQVLQNKNQIIPGHQNISNIGHVVDDDDGIEEGMAMEAEEEEGDEDIDLDNIDYDQLDPQILLIAEQMGVHPKEVLKQLMQMNNDEEGDDDNQGDMEE